MKFKYYRWLTAIIFGLAGCGGGGGSSSNNSGGGPVGDLSKGYLFDFAENGQRALVAVDPTQPSTRFTVAAANTYHVLHSAVVASTFDGATETFSDVRVGTLLYESDGKLFKVSDAKPGTPTPVQVSNATGLSVCPDPSTATDAVHPDNTAVIYETGGIDGNCSTPGDNEFKLIRFGMTSADAPIPAVRVLTTITDVATQTPLGWLSAQGGNIVFYDKNVQNPQTLSETYITEPVDLVDDFFAIDNGVFKFDTTTRAFKRVHTAPVGVTIPDHSIVDATDVYFVRSDQKIFRVPRDGNTLAAEVYSGPEVASLSLLSLTENRIVFQDGFDNTYSIPKNGGVANATLLASNASPPIVSGARVYYSVSGPGTLRAGVVNEDGAAKFEIDNAFYGGFVIPTVLSFGRGLESPFTKLIRFENVNIASGSFAGASVKSIDGATAGTIADLGRLPAGSYNIAFTDILQFGDANFLHSYAGSVSNPVASLFFNASHARSLVTIR